MARQLLTVRWFVKSMNNERENKNSLLSVQIGLQSNKIPFVDKKATLSRKKPRTMMACWQLRFSF